MVSHQVLSGALPSEIGVEIAANHTDLQQAMGLAMHHDAITGTANHDVAKDYSRRLAKGANESMTDYLTMIKKALDKTADPYINDLVYCPLANISVCAYNLTDDEIQVVLHNPTFHKIRRIVSVPIPWSGATVADKYGSSRPSDVIKFPFGSLDDSRADDYKEYMLYFAADLKSQEVVRYVVRAKRSSMRQDNLEDQYDPYNDCDNSCYIASLTYKLTANLGSSDPQEQTNAWKQEHTSSYDGKWKINRGGREYDFRPSMNYYVSSSTGVASGAYIFRPNPRFQDQPYNHPITKVRSFHGEVISQILVEYGRHGTQTYTLPHESIRVTEEFVMVQTLVNEIDIRDWYGKEIILRFGVGMETNQQFTTDSNGIFQVPRQLNTRETFYLNTTYEPESCNYYPITSSLTFLDKVTGITMAIVTDRAQGTTVWSIDDWTEAEVMVHRRCMHNDGKGMQDVLNECEHWNEHKGMTVITNHGIVLNGSDKERLMVENYFNDPVQTLISPENWRYKASDWAQPAAEELPLDIYGFWRPFDEKAFVLRLQNSGATTSFDVERWVKKTYPIPSSSRYRVLELGLSENQPMTRIVNSLVEWDPDITLTFEHFDRYYQPGWEDTAYKELLKKEDWDTTYTFVHGEIKSFLITVQNFN